MSYLVNTFFIILSFSLPFLFKHSLGIRYTRWLLFFILIHQFISLITNSGIILGTLQYDTYGFFALIKQFSQYGFNDRYISSNIFPYLLSIFYFKPYSLLTGQLITIIGYVLSAIMLKKVLLYLKLDKHSTLILILYSINPVHIIITSSIMREPWQIFFLMTIIYYSMQITIDRQLSINKIFIYIFSLILICVFHAGMIYVSFFSFMLSIVMFVLFPKNFLYTRSMKILFFLLSILILALGFFVIKNTYNEFYQSALDYSTTVNKANTSYDVNTSSGSILSIMQSWIYYLFYPFVWKVSSFSSLFACIVGLLRFVLIWYSLKYYNSLKSDKNLQRKVLVLLLYFAFVTFIFGLGTINYGTSMRHNIITFWIIVSLGITGFYSKNNTKIYYRKGYK